MFMSEITYIYKPHNATSTNKHIIQMTSNQIINELAKNKVIEKLVANISPDDNSPGALSSDNQDLSQLIYLTLLEKPNSLIEDLYSKGELIFYVIRIITRNVYSTTSPYYRTIKKFKNKTTDIDDLKNQL